MNVIVDDIGKVVALLNPKYGVGYRYGHELEISNRLIVKGQNPQERDTKYPMIALRLDTREQLSLGMVNYSLNIVIVQRTLKNYNAEQRYTNVFKPILYPIYLAFLDALGDSGLFTWPQDQDVPEHTKIDRPYWGTPKGQNNDANIFNDPLDAIEILNLKINQKPKNC